MSIFERIKGRFKVQHTLIIYTVHYENKLPKIEGIESIGSYLDSVVSLSKIDFQCLSLLNVDFFPFLNYISNGDTPNIIGCCYKIDYVIYFIFTLKVLFKSCYKNCSEFSDGKLIPNKIGPVYKYLYNMAWCVTKMRGPPLRWKKSPNVKLKLSSTT